MVKHWKGALISVVIGALGGFWYVQSVKPWVAEYCCGQVEKVEPVASVSQLSQEPEAANQDVFVCPCGGPGWCVGPRGGVYCVDINGKKKYKPKG